MPNRRWESGGLRLPEAVEGDPARRGHRRLLEAELPTGVEAPIN
ncbi:hypothetical protein WMF27_24040 [Sorangium sp. So ce281]